MAEIIHINAIAKGDPTRTLTLRNQFVRNMQKRFNSIRVDIIKTVDQNDAFGLREEALVVGQAAPSRAFAFERTDRKVDAFMSWLREREEEGVLEIIYRPGALRGTHQAWTDIYIRQAYEKGVRRGRNELKKAGYRIPSLPTERGEINALLRGPYHADRLGALYTRSFNDLRGITSHMDQQISRVLTDGLMRGENPKKIARTLSGEVKKISRVRANVLARTEVIRAHHVANIAEFRSWGVRNVYVEAEWVTAGVGVCPICSEREGRIYTLDEIEPILPAHPNCRCVAKPVPVEGRRTGAPVDIPPETGLLARNNPMQAIGRKYACVSDRFTLISNIKILAPPQSCVDYVRGDDGKWRLEGEKVGESEQKKLEKLRIPPAWRNVVVAKNPKARIQAIGLDQAGRWQYRYSAAHIAEAKRKKFNRVKLFSRDMESIRRNIDEGIKVEDTRAMLLRLEDKTAIRAGSTRDTRAVKKAYGLTTLKNRHVEIDRDKIFLEFNAKKGIKARYEIKDKVLAPWLKRRKAETKLNDYLFADVSARDLNKYLKDISGKKYTLKDFRTYHATRIAREELEKVNAVNLTKKAKKEIVKKVSSRVADFLKNTPTVAKSAYIDPMVWDIIGGLP